MLARCEEARAGCQRLLQEAEATTRRLLDILRFVEWRGDPGNYGGDATCSNCRREQRHGHAGDCELDAALAATPEGQSVESCHHPRITCPDCGVTFTKSERQAR